MVGSSRWTVAVTMCMLIVTAIQPSEVEGQELPAERPAAVVPVHEPGSSSPSAAEALRLPGIDASLLGLPAEPIETAADGERPVAMPQESSSGRGKVFMIAGAAALVGGLIVGKDIGTIIAAGGVVLGVYGVILYF